MKRMKRSIFGKRRHTKSATQILMESKAAPKKKASKKPERKK